MNVEVNPQVKRSILFAHKDTGDIDRGGVCVLFKTLASGLSKKGWGVHVATTQELNMEGVQTHMLPFIDDPLQYSKGVTTVVKDVSSAIAECSTWRFELYDYSQQTDRRSKVVVRADPSAGTIFNSAQNLDEGEKTLCKNADLILAVSEFARDDIQKKYQVPKIYVVYNGIPISQGGLEDGRIGSGELLFPASNESQPLVERDVAEIIKPDMINIFWVGKPTKMKGFHILENIVNNAPDNFNFVINTGYAPPEVEWDKSNYERCIFIRGLTKTDQLFLLKHSSVFLSTSTIEGFGIAVAEALQMGLPVVLNAACDAYHEFLPNDGVILTDMQDPYTIVEAVKEHISKKVDYSRLPEQFTQEYMVARSIEYYERLLTDKY